MKLNVKALWSATGMGVRQCFSQDVPPYAGRHGRVWGSKQKCCNRIR